MIYPHLIIFFSFSFLLSFVLIGLSYLVVEKKPYQNKISSYECGFASINQPTSPFSIRFFIVGVIFLIFDLEILYLAPWSYASGIFSLKNQKIVWGFFFFVIFGLIYEYKKGGLEWL